MENEIRATTARDVVCPECFRQLQHPEIVGDGYDTGRHIRTYYGWCFECNKGAMVIQFERNGRWVIHKYKKSILLDGSGVAKIEGDWIVLSEMPQPLVVTGQGEYQQAQEVDFKYFDLLAKLQKIVAAAGEAINTLIELAKREKT